jgi:hypothetical protein
MQQQNLRLAGSVLQQQQDAEQRLRQNLTRLQNAIQQPGQDLLGLLAGRKVRVACVCVCMRAAL